ncbi:kinase-like domain-containing protein [Thamnocephalis sphaerospora]|uniref:Kinase-like domain-containing protein n=1 Tax=Thamnocephalis sphaerospora TaxID=78915 RepID=A0A4P9XRR2_9FUNG|nr:kinase-like domain-containing protein [Thamnocephalis sphaerospora]|eukprot:RKP08642.1 kinase-like domain-containing protein [Thamnocephalis sphaerospora]
MTRRRWTNRANSFDVYGHVGRRLDDADYFGRQVHLLVRSLLPDWHDVEDPEQLQITRLSGALTNRVYEVRARDPNDTRHQSRRVLLRVYGDGVDQLFSRAKELDWLRKLSAVGLGPRLLAVFGNGRLEEYLRSTTLTRDDIRTPEDSARIARNAAQLHQIVKTYPPPETTQDGDWLASVYQWLPLARKAVARLLADSTDGTSPAFKPEDRAEVQQVSASLERLVDTIPQLAEAVRKINSPIVFGHNDMQYGNILRLRSEPDTLVLIDFEYAGYNPRGYDIANHFCEWSANYHGPTPHLLEPQHMPNAAERDIFLRAYLEESLGRVPSDDEVETLWNEVQAYIPCSHALWSLWGLLQAGRTDIEFDYLAYGAQRQRLACESALALGVTL